jgi:hypothetical protein
MQIARFFYSRKSDYFRIGGALLPTQLRKPISQKWGNALSAGDMKYPHHDICGYF